ncbi:hypothetical protein [Paenirhodobacter sp. CAU 1674]|uniref:head-tail joining protein n=1 Tax=Paenirhodobacter sp. CAU 1674 TaxID=3032596 RepID=UPI0023DBB12A|nr:hypothetical protein [Paenirhodobacter sp. CAU 1674]MDF2140854.1 hypothetical protein [Paenirhodobacter sp. CAU 1674]
MSAFSRAVDAAFRNVDIASDAIYQVGGAGLQTNVRVILSSPDRVAQFSSGRFVVDSVGLEVRVADAPELAVDDMFIIGTDTYVVIGAPERDSQRLVWSAEVKLAV